MSEKEKKRKYTYLTVGQKREVIKKIKDGVKKQTILHEYNICRKTYVNLLADSSKYLEEGNDNCKMLDRKSLKSASDKELDTAVIIWFQQVCNRGDPISGPILKEKALLLSKKLNPSSTFKVSMRKYE